MLRADHDRRPIPSLASLRPPLSARRAIRTPCRPGGRRQPVELSLPHEISLSFADCTQGRRFPSALTPKSHRMFLETTCVIVCAAQRERRVGHTRWESSSFPCHSLRRSMSTLADLLDLGTVHDGAEETGDRRACNNDHRPPCSLCATKSLPAFLRSCPGSAHMAPTAPNSRPQAEFAPKHSVPNSPPLWVMTCVSRHAERIGPTPHTRPQPQRLAGPHACGWRSNLMAWAIGGSCRPGPPT